MSTDEYQGWANRETWAVALYINNDQGWQESVYEALNETLRNTETVMGDDGYTEVPGTLTNWEAGNLVKESVENALFGETVGSTWHLNKYVMIALHDIGSLWRVDWDALGASFLADIAELDDQS